MVPGEYQALLVGTQIVPLPHPDEDRTIRQHGESFLSASLKGKYLRVTQRVCMQCGALIDAPQISFGAPGCLPALIAGVATGLYLALKAQWEILEAVEAAFGAVCGALLLSSGLGFAYSKLVWRARQQSISRDACPSCGSKIQRSINSLVGQTVPLNEQTRTVTVERRGARS